MNDTPSPLYFPSHITEAISTCALRFDGYKYERDAHLSASQTTGAGLSHLITPIVQSLKLHEDDNMNFAAFFALQRYLHKWGGEYLTKYADEHIAFDFLFLHLYNCKVPVVYANQEYCTQWRREFEDHQEEIVGFVRNTFRRQGSGPKINVGLVSEPISAKSAMAAYKETLVRRYWAYQQRFFPNAEELLEKEQADGGRPPVFLQSASHYNVLTKPGADPQEVARLLALMPEHHQWFRSMNSSQALALSILGNLAHSDLLDCLADLDDDDGDPLFGEAVLSAANFTMEHKVKHLGEPRSTSLDGYIAGDYQVAIECKFTEAEFGACSRPRLTPTDAKYVSEHCDGTYTRQASRQERCPLTESGVQYWQHVPQLFHWQNDADLIPCPLHTSYQLVRNILAVGVQPDGTVSLDRGHVVLLYDARNPANHDGGNCAVGYQETKAALKNPRMLRKCSWQRIAQHLRASFLLPWLTEQLELKYGL